MQPLQAQAQSAPRVRGRHLAQKCLQTLPLKQLHKLLPLQAQAHYHYTHYHSHRRFIY